jgi:two-component system, cell cycle sensor histidine kinase and response regulator CckA
LVEEEATIREFTREVLRTQGYSVLEACDGTEALSIFEQQGDLIDLMLTDVVTPLLGGAELAKRVLSMRPETKVVCKSGYANDAIVHNG